MSNLLSQIEDRNNFIRLIGLICDEYKLDPQLPTNITNIKSFLGPLSGEYILSQANTLEEANTLIVKLYGQTVETNRFSIPENISATEKYLLDVINTPGDENANQSAAYKDTFKSRKEQFRETLSGPESILSLDLPSRIEVIKYLNYQSLFREEYIVIDSRYQNTVNTDSTKMIFSLITNSKTKSEHGGIIVGNTIRDIIEIEIYPFTIPYKPVYATFYNKITLGFNEWLANSFEAYEGGQFHFLFDIDRIENNLIYLKPVNNIYTFSKPVNHIDSMTLSFGAVYPKISFDPDRMVPQKISFTDTLGVITFADTHNLVSGDLVYISGFNTPDPARDALVIADVNRSEGHVIVKKDNYSIVINVDLTAVRHELPIGSGRYPIDEFKQNVSIYFASKRIQIQLKLRYLTSYQ